MGYILYTSEMTIDLNKFISVFQTNETALMIAVGIPPRASVMEKSTRACWMTNETQT